MTPIVPGKPADSYLIERISDPDEDTRMPPAEHGPALTRQEIAQLSRWIEQGAKWEEHWAFAAPRSQQVPNVVRASWPRVALDHFILARLEREGLDPAPESSRAEWLRRASLDLTGLPPSDDDYRRFESLPDEEAYAREADRLLDLPSFGERWASMWLDLARYADTHGFETDDHRDIWPYRDWVIRAFNSDMPYDQFTVEQLAGDLLPEATVGSRLATAFHRNTQTNAEGGTDDEEFRTAAVLDRVNTTWQVWQGVTFRCTQCHAHPYDPFGNDEYYRFAAFFNTTLDEDLSEDFPRLAIPNDVGQWGTARDLDHGIAELQRELFSQYECLANNSRLWCPLQACEAKAAGQTRLRIHAAKNSGPSEVWAEGTISAHDTFELEFALPDEVDLLTALRIDALPKDEAMAVKIPEAGFALTRLKALLVPPGDDPPIEIEFGGAYCDDPDPQFEPSDSLRDNVDGWSRYTRMFYRQHVEFILRQTLAVPPCSRLRIEMKFERNGSGGTALAIQRSTYAVSSSPAWTRLVADPGIVEMRRKLDFLRDSRHKIPGTPTPVMVEQPTSLARRSFMFVRGNWLDRGAEVQPSVPKIMPKLPAGPPTRLAMARWLASPDNPLTARVMVNRLWQEIFGVGLVETADDFGSSGTPPSHQELLDFLALRFEYDMKWSVKRLLRELVLSATYRQSAVASTEKLARDPQNRLRSRGPRNRLTAEMMRDQALLLSGQLATKMFGPPVMPPQPEGIWRSVYSDAKWITSTGEDRYRRAVYTYCKRTSGYPPALTFDMPSRDVCVARRFTTNTPLQALVTLNDEAFIELAASFAQRLQAMCDGPENQIAQGYFLATGRTISDAKLSRLTELYHEAGAAFDAAPCESTQLAADRQLYALTIVANALLNLDEVLTK